jgi:uncharacterized protein (TIGR03067 family)
MRACVLLLALAGLAFAPAPFPKPEKKSAPLTGEQLQGTWRLVGYLYDGKDLLPAATTPIWRVDGNRVLISSARGGDQTVYGLRIDPGTSPVDFALLSSSGKPTHVGSTKLEGDRWTIVMVDSGSRQRPTRFAGEAGYLLTFERVR